MGKRKLGIVKIKVEHESVIGKEEEKKNIMVNVIKEKI